MAKLRSYVEQGGTLISEGLPAYFGDHGRAGADAAQLRARPVLRRSRKLRRVHARSAGEAARSKCTARRSYGRYFLQEYEAKGGQPAGHYANGHVAAVENHSGKGRTLLIGTFPGGGYYLHHSPGAKAFFAGLLKLAGVEQTLQSSSASVQARLHRGTGGNYLWVVNPSRTEANATVSLSTQTPSFQSAEDVWGNRPVSVADRKITVSVPARDAAVIALR